MTAGVRERWAATAQRVFAAYPSIATVSVVSTRLAEVFGHGDVVTSDVVQVSSAALPVCFINSAVADLLPGGDITARIEAATLRGLHHAWIVTADGGATAIDDLVPAADEERVILAALPIDDASARAIALGIDAAWLLGGESGAQVFVFELLKAMARDARIDRIVLLSDRGVVPAALDGLPRITGRTWTEAAASGDCLDVLHRPYQPGADTEFDRYRQVARAVAVTILDFIAYDNPAYHESPFAFRTYQRAFDDKVCEADQVFAISRHIGDRLQRQFAHRLLAPVLSIHLGTDHLDAPNRAEPHVPGPLAPVAPQQYVAVLGNDFAHKNRDFAVNVFAAMCRRGYGGRLVLAGFHLDAGSSYDYELNGAGEFADRVLRVGALPGDQKTWLLRNAEAILYPTCSEGFGLIPFEAAALGTPTAFVRFGPLAETMPAVPAAAAWRVDEFTDHVFALLANPGAFIAAVNEARRPLTWTRCADATITGYQQMMRDAATWHRAVADRREPDTLTRINETMSEYWRRAAGRARRLAGPRERKS